MAKRKKRRPLPFPMSRKRRKPSKKAASARKAAARKVTARKAARKAPKRKAVARKAVTRKTAARKAPAKKTAPRRSSGQVARRAPAKTVKAAAPKAPRRTAAQAARKAPALDRQRRTVLDEDIVASPPSSLDLDRTASAVRSGRHQLSEKFREHTESSPALTGGDVDADWESAYSVGDEAPGGDNPTPDQDIVDDIGKAIGVVYEDNEELKGEKKISDRDKKRWELDPASSDDYEDR